MRELMNYSAAVLMGEFMNFSTFSGIVQVTGHPEFFTSYAETQPVKIYAH